MHPFHVTIHRAPETQRGGRPLEQQGRSFATLDLRPAERREPLTVGFAAAVGRLERLPRMFVEPDGSFVWRCGADSPDPWQIDGLLVDHVDRLQYVELKGKCPEYRLKQLRACWAAKHTRLMFQLIHQAVYLDEATFHHWLYG